MIERVNAASLAAPSGFSHAVAVTDTVEANTVGANAVGANTVGANPVAAGARTVYLAGQTALDANGSIVGAGDVVAQFEQALSNLVTALRAAGGAPEHLVQVTIYIVDVRVYRARAEEIGDVWQRLCGRDYPAAAGVGVARLWDDEALVEIAGIAAVPG